MADLVRFNLEQAGLDVAVARNGRIALELLKEKKFDLVVTDYQMPEMDGRELCVQLRRNSTWSGIPVLMLTAKEMELDVVRLREELGIQDVLAKPFSPSELTQSILTCLALVGAES